MVHYGGSKSDCSQVFSLDSKIHGMVRGRFCPLPPKNMRLRFTIAGLGLITEFPTSVITHILAKVLLQSLRRIISPLTLGKPHACLLLNHIDH